MNEMPITNDHLPANHQDVDSIVEYEDQAEPSFAELHPDEVVAHLSEDPANILNLDKNQLAFAYEYLDEQIKDLEAAKTTIKDQIFHLMKADSEEAGNYLCYYANKNTFPDLTLDVARDLGFTKVEEKIDNTKAKRAYENGADLGRVETARLQVMRYQRKDA